MPTMATPRRRGTERMALIIAASYVFSAPSGPARRVVVRKERTTDNACEGEAARREAGTNWSTSQLACARRAVRAMERLQCAR
jgi:hypothetical protein